MSQNFTCGNCKYWDADPHTKDASNLGAGAILGTCRRLPPVALVMWHVNPKSDTFMPTDPPAIIQPPTGRNDWCGEWKLKVIT